MGNNCFTETPCLPCPRPEDKSNKKSAKDKQEDNEYQKREMPRGIMS